MSLFGKTLTQLQSERWNVKRKVVAELWKRNKLSPNALGYKLAETATVQRDGSEITEYRLYKLIDYSVATLSSEVQVKVETGLTAINEKLR